jgi:hypothetical protein
LDGVFNFGQEQLMEKGVQACVDRTAVRQAERELRHLLHRATVEHRGEVAGGSDATVSDHRDATETSNWRCPSETPLG